MRCVPLLAFWGQFGYSLHCVITRSLYGFLLCVVDFFVLRHLFFGYYLSASFTVWGNYGCRGRVTGSKPSIDY